MSDTGVKRKLKYRDIVMIEPTGEIGYVLLTDGVSAASFCY
jgi:hypothetical protein